jgi:WD40 repeat protein
VGHGKLITDVACHPINEEIFTTSSLDGTIKVWSMRDPSGPLNSIVMGQPVWSVAYNQNGDYLVAVSEHGTVTLINCSKASETRRDDFMQVV